MKRSKNFGFKSFEYTRHVIEKADERDIDLGLVEEAIEYGEMIAEYPDDKPYKSFFMPLFCQWKTSAYMLCASS